MKIKVSYTDEEEAEVQQLLELLRPVLDGFRIKKSAGTPPHKHLYFIPRILSAGGEK